MCQHGKMHSCTSPGPGSSCKHALRVSFRTRTAVDLCDGQHLSDLVQTHKTQHTHTLPALALHRSCPASGAGDCRATGSRPWASLCMCVCVCERAPARACASLRACIEYTHSQSHMRTETQEQRQTDMNEHLRVCRACLPRGHATRYGNVGIDIQIHNAPAVNTQKKTLPDVPLV